LHILNLVDSVEHINYGIWNTVTKLFPYLEDKGCHPEIWFPESSDIPDTIKEVPWYKIENSRAFDIKLSGYTPDNTLIITHGLWKEPTFWGAAAKNKGFNWVVIPHGMLEPWSMRHKWWKKFPYYNMIEKRKIEAASAYIAVGLTEYHNLRKHFDKRVHLLSNGIKPISVTIEKSTTQEVKYKFLFLSRLHKKKGVVPLLEGWLNSKAFRHGAQLKIVGPDEGELDKLNQIMTYRSMNINTSTVSIKGPTYGAEKETMLREADFFVLPSLSEGFPTAVLEAMSYGCLPIISEGCNFPQALENDVAVEIRPDSDNIAKVLNNLFAIPRHELDAVRQRAKEFVDTNFSLDNLSQQVYGFYNDLIDNKL